MIIKKPQTQYVQQQPMVQQYVSQPSNYESKKVIFKFHKSRVISETEKTLLVNITNELNVNKPQACWIAKKLLYTSPWVNYISAYIPEGFTFKIENTNEMKEISADNLASVLGNDFI